MKSHRFDAVSMVFGVVFAGIGSLFLTGSDVGSLVARFWPAAVVLLGLAMLFSTRRPDAPGTAGPPRLPEEAEPSRPSD